ncbi:hypothetical protein [Chitinophaga dinghuensis]|nr:hypothetical protein [Chitinophaga dinghuensis]
MEKESLQVRQTSATIERAKLFEKHVETSYSQIGERCQISWRIQTSYTHTCVVDPTPRIMEAVIQQLQILQANAFSSGLLDEVTPTHDGLRIVGDKELLKLWSSQSFISTYLLELSIGVNNILRNGCIKDFSINSINAVNNSCSPFVTWNNNVGGLTRLCGSYNFSLIDDNYVITLKDLKANFILEGAPYTNLECTYPEICVTIPSDNISATAAGGLLNQAYSESSQLMKYYLEDEVLPPRQSIVWIRFLGMMNGHLVGLKAGSSVRLGTCVANGVNEKIAAYCN